MNWLKFFLSLLPDLSGFKEMDFKVSSHRGQLFAHKKTESYHLYFSQGFEPDHPEFGPLVDFDIPDGFFVVKFLQPTEAKQREAFHHELLSWFRFVVDKGDYCFFFDQRLDFSSEKIGVRTEKVVSYLNRDFFRKT